MSENGGPGAGRAVAGALLRRLREDAGLSQQASADAISCAKSKISRLEAGLHTVRPADIARLLTLYGVADPIQRDHVLSLAAGRTPGWWHELPLPLWFCAHLALEDDARQIRTYETTVVPSLLQTPAYSLAAARVTSVTGSTAPADQEIWPEVCRRRADRLLNGDRQVRLWAVMEESALTLPVGDPRTRLEQLDALIAAAKTPNVVLQINPAASTYRPRGGPFTLLRRADADPDTVLLHQLHADQALVREEEVAAYRQAHTRLSVAARPPDDTPHLLTRLRAEVAALL
ncbi:helix-turn-helix domain-containing protein [Bailinhaonella thermotolerans]|uniref:XRE family transcriptional regulator n=1 Tax=Bailinhaonella thermotolerans TaxID=1070861 RepID=A0A3A4AFH8_9ACTN|nr:helix-turn-helix transcriptional regulator [Bailinhaonella thermotolerans]RJL27109.1 XRE family transcriptional regulator [Bailinhaonella thermotolerans]